jgi:AcrR family transcriptional regulator
MPATRRAERLRPRKRPLQTRSRRTVDAVVKAAAQVFATRGYAGGTTNHIAERAGVSIGTLYEYFPNKDALLVALMEKHIRDGERVLQRAAAEMAGRTVGIRESVRHFVRAMVDFHAHERALHRVLFEESPLPRRVRQTLTELEQRVTGQVETLIREAPDVSVKDPALTAAIVVQAVEGLTHKLVLHGERDEDIDLYVDEICRLVTSYLTAVP